MHGSGWYDGYQQSSKLILLLMRILMARRNITNGVTIAMDKIWVARFTEWRASCGWAKSEDSPLGGGLMGVCDKSMLAVERGPGKASIRHIRIRLYGKLPRTRSPGVLMRV